MVCRTLLPPRPPRVPPATAAVVVVLRLLGVTDGRGTYWKKTKKKIELSKKGTPYKKIQTSPRELVMATTVIIITLKQAYRWSLISLLMQSSASNAKRYAWFTTWWPSLLFCVWEFPWCAIQNFWHLLSQLYYMRRCRLTSISQNSIFQIYLKIEM